MKKTGLEPQKGDWIVHTRHGLGQIMGSCAQVIEGEKKVCLEIKTADLTYWLPVSDIGKNHVRAVSSPSNFQDALVSISDLPEPLSENFRIRLNYISGEIANGSLISKARLIRDMNERNARKDIHVNEKKTFENLKTQFVEELMLACHVNRQTAQARLDKALRKNIPVVKDRGM